MALQSSLVRLFVCASVVCPLLRAADEPQSGVTPPIPRPPRIQTGVPVRELVPVDPTPVRPAASITKPTAAPVQPGQMQVVQREVAAAANPANYSEAQGPVRPASPGDYDVPIDGFFPTQRMIERFLRHAATEIGQQLQADTEQVDYFREVLTNRVPQWMQRNRGSIKRLTNEYIEAMLDDQPPPAGDVADWAQRALPLFDQAQRLIDECVEDLRPSLSEDQALELEAELAAMRVAGSFFRSKLELWQAGGYDPEVDWPQGSRNRQVEQLETAALLNAQKTAREEVLGGQIQSETAAPNPAAVAGSTIAAAPQSVLDSPFTETPQPDEATFDDPWARFVADFVTRYDLTVEQTETAYRYLHEAQRLRDRYQQKRIDEFRRIEAALRGPGEKDIATLKADFDRLQAPIDGYFEQLQKRLDKLPTRAQRRAALERDGQTAVAEARG